MRDGGARLAQHVLARGLQLVLDVDVRLVEMNVCTRGRSASRTASAARSMSAAWARARPAMTGPCTSRAIARTAWKSPGEAIGNPASITSTPSRASCWAISSFSLALSEMPGDCSPSLRVVSKMMTRLGSMAQLLF